MGINFDILDKLHPTVYPAPQHDLYITIVKIKSRVHISSSHHRGIPDIHLYQAISKVITQIYLKRWERDKILR